MKSPWQLGLLALAVTGVSAYDYVFFKNYHAQKQTHAPMSVAQPAALHQEQLLFSLPEPAAVGGEVATGESDCRPFISREELQLLSRQEFVHRKYVAEMNSRWPAHDPFAARANEENDPGAREIPEVVIHQENSGSKPQAPPEPHCVFSGTLVQGATKLALVDGTPMTVGDRLGVWQLTRIESDYIVFEAGEEVHRIILKGAEPQSGFGKDPS